MRHRPCRALPRPRSPRYTLGASVIACALALSSAGCDVGRSILVPLVDTSEKDASEREASVKDAPAADAPTTDAPEVGMDAVVDVGLDAPGDAGNDSTLDASVDGSSIFPSAPDAGADDAAAVTVVCGPGETDCSGACHNLVADPNHCGACGRACAPGLVCSDAVCMATCSPPSTRCGAECVLLGDNPLHCGACGRSCLIADTCSGGVCTPLVSASASGCADGTREAFTDTTVFPDIAACAGGFSVPGVFPAPVRAGVAACATSGNNSGTNVNGAGCSAADLCGAGWHICRAGEVGLVSGGLGCSATTFPVDQFFAAAVSGPGCHRCAVPSNTVLVGCTSSSCTPGCRERNDLNNGLFGCGAGRASVDCELTVTAGDRCVDVPAGAWTCPSDTSESQTVTKAQAAGGGVLCCRG